MKKKSYLNLSIDKFTTGAAILLVVCNVAQAQTNNQTTTINVTENVTRNINTTETVNKTVNTSGVNKAIDLNASLTAINGELVDVGVVNGNTQILTGSSASNAFLHNVIVSDKFTLSSTAIGNIIGGDKANYISNNSQSVLPGAFVWANTNIQGADTNFKDAKIDVTAVGNIISGTTIAQGLAKAGAGVISGNTQSQAGHVQATYTWNLDPSTTVNVTATSLGNAIMLNSHVVPKVQ